VGTPTIAYNVAGLSDSVKASNGVLSAPDPKNLSSVLHEFLATWLSEGLPDISPNGVIPWSQVAARILAIAANFNPTLKSFEPSNVQKEVL
jgi:hypothetical protein